MREHCSGDSNSCALTHFRTFLKPPRPLALAAGCWLRRVACCIEVVPARVPCRSPLLLLLAARCSLLAACCCCCCFLLAACCLLLAACCCLLAAACLLLAACKPCCCCLLLHRATSAAAADWCRTARRNASSRTGRQGTRCAARPAPRTSYFAVISHIARSTKSLNYSTQRLLEFCVE